MEQFPIMDAGYPWDFVEMLPYPHDPAWYHATPAPPRPVRIDGGEPNPLAMQRYLSDFDAPSFSVFKAEDGPTYAYPGLVFADVTQGHHGIRDSSATRRNASPGYSDLSISHASSNGTSEAMDRIAFSPHMNHHYHCTGHVSPGRYNPPAGGGGGHVVHSEHSPSTSFVAPHQVQRHADAHFDIGMCEPARVNFHENFHEILPTYHVQEGFEPEYPDHYDTLQPRADSKHEDATSASPSGSSEQDMISDHDSTVHDSPSPRIRRRRLQPIQAAKSLIAISRSSKPHHNKRNASRVPNRRNTKLITATAGTERAFPCPLAIYGCPSSFGSKNEWKRHVNTQHMCFGYWHCKQCPNEDTKPNDFNRKDLFIQHIRRMHSSEHQSHSETSAFKSAKNPVEDARMAAAAKDSYRLTRALPKKCGCLFCSQTFAGSGAWDERMEHVGWHLEKTRKERGRPVHPQDWRTDDIMEEWLMDNQIIVRRNGLLRLAN